MHVVETSGLDPGAREAISGLGAGELQGDGY